VADCADVFLVTDGDIREVVAAILRSDYFRQPAHYQAMAKTPLEFVTGLLRNFSADISYEQTGYLMHVMGMPLFYQGSPQGFSELGADWINADQLAKRLLAVNGLLFSTDPSSNYLERPLELFTGRGYHTAAGILGYLAELTLNNNFDGAEWQLAMDLLTDGSGQIDLADPLLESRLRRVIALMLNTPGYQLQ
jgi:hypothetical protein